MMNSSVGSDTNNRWDDLSRLFQIAEESPDWKGQPAVESTDGSNLMNAVTENKPPARVRVKPRGKSSRRRMATYGGDGTRTSKTMYTDITEISVKVKRAARSLSGGRLRR